MASKSSHSNSLARRLSAAAGLALAVGLLLSIAAPASAYSPRTYESQLSAGLFHPLTVAFDSSDRVWVADKTAFEFNNIDQFNSLDERLPVQIVVGSQIEGSIAADHSNGDLYVPTPFNDQIHVYSATGAALKEFGGAGSLAVDNSKGETAGRLYESAGSVVESLNENGSPVAFKGSAGYIEGDKLTGTPSGPFGGPGSIAVGPEGEIYVVDSGEVDEFNSEGIFVERSPALARLVAYPLRAPSRSTPPTATSLLLPAALSSTSSPPPALTSARSPAKKLPPNPSRASAASRSTRKATSTSTTISMDLLPGTRSSTSSAPASSSPSWPTPGSQAEPRPPSPWAPK